MGDDDEWMPESLSALLGMQPDDPNSNSAVSVNDAIDHLMKTREISARRARQIVENGRCDECKCVLGDPVDADVCECACHCKCCCPPLFHCLVQCECKCECHYDPNLSDDEEEETDVEHEQATEDLDNGTAEEKFNDDVVEATPSSQTSGAELADRSRPEPSSSVREEEKKGTATTMEDEPEAMSDDDGTTEPTDGKPAGSTAAASSEMSDVDDDVPDRRHDEKSPSDKEAGARTIHSQPENDGSAANVAQGDSGDNDQAVPQTSDKQLAQLAVYDLTELLLQCVTRVDEEAEIESKKVIRELFKKAYDQVVAGGKPLKTTNKHLPQLKQSEADLLYVYVTTVVLQLKYTAARTLAAVKDIAYASTKSSWSTTRIISDRLETARTPRDPPTNVWAQPDSESSLPFSEATRAAYRFDTAVYTTDEIEKYQAICSQEHVFAETTREPTTDEWNVIMGLVSGSILASATPQFLKRCCTLTHIMWIHEEMQKQEGELWVRLPLETKMFNYGQTTRRLAAAIRQSAAHFKWSDTRLQDMLATVKSIAYSKSLHSLHFYFFTKADAAKWEQMLLPFRNQRLKLVNPERKLKRSALNNRAGLPTDDDDGLVNDRYQAQFRLRILNLSRAIQVRLVGAYLQRRTNGGLKTAIPLDTYGQFAEGSLMWDFYSSTPVCPPELVGIYRLDWDGHPLLLQHRPETGLQPCLQCAQMGHQTANCTTAEAEWNSTTLKVTAAEIRALMPAKQPWKTLADVRAIFAALQAPPTDQTTSSDQTSTTPANAARGDSNSTPVPPTAAPPTNGPPESTAPPSTQTDTGSGAGGEEPKTPGPRTTNKTGQQWNTIKRAKRGPQPRPNKAGASAPSSHDAVGHTVPAPAQNNNGKGPFQSSLHQNKFIDLAASDDEDEDDDHEEQKHVAGASTGTPPAGTTTTATPTGAKTTSIASITDSPIGTRAEDDEAIEQALWLSRLEQLREDIIRTTQDGQPSFSPEHVINSIERARPHLGPKSSRAWVLEAINGRLTDTPGTGNCQFYAFIEAAAQRDLKHTDGAAALLGAVTAYKYALYLAYLTSTNADRRNTNAAQLLDIPAGIPTDTTEAQIQEMVKKFYQDLARSGSALNTFLEERLWGTFDTIRAGVQVLDQPVFLMTETSDPMHCCLNVFRKMKNSRGETFVAMSQPGAADWLTEIEDEVVKTKRAPIVLAHGAKHYNCVIFDRHQPANVRPHQKKLKTQLLPDYWNQTSLDAIIDGAKKQPSTTDKRISSRRAVLASEAKITVTDVVSFLTDEGWSVEEKTELVGILVSGATNLRELLTFSASTPGSIGTSQQTDAGPDDDSGSKSAESAYEPSDSSEEETDGSQAYSLPSQGDADYRAWADGLWEPVREHWFEQTNMKLPALTNVDGLQKWAEQLPVDLIQAGRFCENPFALLDHIPKEGLRTWMAPGWLNYCVLQLKPHVATVTESHKRAVLFEWIDLVSTTCKTDIRLTLWKDKQKWALLQDVLPYVLDGPTAIPLLAASLSLKTTYLVLLDQLFPDLAKHALRASGWKETEDRATIALAYEHSKDFSKALNTGIRNHSWGPVSDYMNRLEMGILQMPSRRC